MPDDELGALYRFFVVETPCERLSSSAITFESRGWGKKPWKTTGNRLHGRLLTDLGFRTGETLFIGTSVDETKALFKDAMLDERFARNVCQERIAIYDSERNQFLSIMAHIRHAMAHGRFATARRNGEIFFFFESGTKGRSSDAFNVRSRMVLKRSTLLKWIAIIKRDEETGA